MPTKRLYLRFSLRAIFAIVTFAAIVIAPVSYLYRRDRLELSAVREAARLNGYPHWEEAHRFGFLPGARHCTKLAFFECDLADEDLSFLARLPQLRDLDMAGSSVTDSHMRSIGRMHSLECLSVAKTLITDAGLSCLDKCSHLKKLLIAETAVEGTSFETLSRLPMLECINADFCLLDDEALFWLGRCKQLRIIVASSRSITKRGVRGLCNARELEEVHLAADVTPQGAEPLFALPRLKHLSVHGRDGFVEKWRRVSDHVWQLTWPQTRATVTQEPEGVFQFTWPRRIIEHANEKLSESAE
jgi:hypothetical protein